MSSSVRSPHQVTEELNILVSNDTHTRNFETNFIDDSGPIITDPGMSQGDKQLKKKPNHQELQDLPTDKSDQTFGGILSGSQQFQTEEKSKPQVP